MAVEAAQEKHAVDVAVLRLPPTAAFAEYFVLCSGESSPQLRAIREAIEERLDRQGVRLAHREGKHDAEWMLLDYGSFVVHIFSQRAREYYDLERLWRSAERIALPSAEKPPSMSSSTDTHTSPQ